MAVLLVAAGCTTGRPSAVAHPAAATARTPAPTQTRTRTPTQTARAARSPGAAYLALANADNRRLDVAFDRLDGPDRDNLAASQADLRAIAATERDFDQRLSHLALPRDTAASSSALIHANETRAELTRRVAGSVSLDQLNARRASLNAANGPVERAVVALRADMGLPPPDRH